MNTGSLGVVIWMNMPSHHQEAFFSALRCQGLDLIVRYYDRVTASRVAMGWRDYVSLPRGEMYVARSLKSVEEIPDWQRRIHVIPGYGDAFLRSLARYLSNEHVPWVHWSEATRPGLRWWVSLPRKKRWASLINMHALGALGISTVAAEEFVQWGVRPSSVGVVPYAVAAHSEAASPDEACFRFLAGRRAFLFLGQLVRRKRPDLLIKAFARVSCDDRSSNWALILAGTGPEAVRCRRLISHLGIRERVLLRGAVPCSHVAHVLATSSVMVLPSEFDGWGVPLNEAASAGLALVASDAVGAAHHLIDPGVNGFRFRSGNEDQLASILLTYITAPTLAATHGAESKRLAAGYSPHASATRFTAIVKSWLVAEKARL